MPKCARAGTGIDWSDPVTTHGERCRLLYIKRPFRHVQIVFARRRSAFMEISTFFDCMQIMARHALRPPRPAPWIRSQNALFRWPKTHYLGG